MTLTDGMIKAAFAEEGFDDIAIIRTDYAVAVRSNRLEDTRDGKVGATFIAEDAGLAKAPRMLRELLA